VTKSKIHRRKRADGETWHNTANLCINGGAKKQGFSEEIIVAIHGRVIFSP